MAKVESVGVTPQPNQSWRQKNDFRRFVPFRVGLGRQRRAPCRHHSDRATAERRPEPRRGDMQ